LGKIHNNVYGTCEMCEEEINIERLKVKNFARYCITCREVVEKEQK
jgi:DnaK suppressor protein